jgi:DNA repair exonuclease SbcCD nuclease subunit
MIKKIFAISDLHISNYRNLDMYEDNLNKLVDELQEKTKELNKEEVRIVLLGDLFNNKNIISNEAMLLASNFIYKLEQIAFTYAIAGNHDTVLQNDRLDSITTLFKISNFKNSAFIDMELGYESGVYNDENVSFALFSIYDDYSPIDIKELKEQMPNNIIIGLFHGSIVGGVLPNGYATESGIDKNVFSDCDLTLAGHIHKYQEIKIQDSKFIYVGSFVQKDFGETISQHGYLEVNINEDKTYDYLFHELKNEYGFFNIEIGKKEDIDNDKEILINF